MDELNLYMPLVRQLITSLLMVYATMSFMDGAFVEPIATIAMVFINIGWMLIVQHRKNKKVVELKQEVKELK